jgi:tetratricopeptide (TPR) repeat protein
MQEILNHLFKIGGLKIPSSTSSMRFKGSKLSVKEIASELNVMYVLEGNVSKSGDNVRIIVRMINGKDERLIWTEDYKRALTAINLLEIQSDVAQQVAENMKVFINPEVKNRIEAKPTINTEAYNLFLQAKYLPLEKAKPLLEKAIILDPGFAEAYARLAYCWIDRGMFDGDLDREQVLKKAEPLIEKALQLDINSVFSHTIMATLRLWYYWDFVSVEKDYRTFMLIAPSNTDLHTWFTDYLLAAGRFEEALSITKLDFDQDKKNAYNWAYLALAYYFNENQKAAIETIRTARRLFPEDKFLLDAAIGIFVNTAQYKNAIEIYEEFYPDSQVHNIYPRLLGLTAIAHFESGNVSMSTIFLNELLSRSRNSPIGSPSFFAAAMYAAMGDNNNAIQFLEKAFNDHEVEMYWLKVEPLFIPLHGDGRFENLLLKIGLK